MGFAGALSLLASLKAGRRGGRRRAPEKHEVGASRATRDVIQQPFTADAASPTRGDRYRRWLNNAMTGLWVVALLSVVAYAVIEGEMAMARLDDLALVATYSLSP